MSRFLGNVLVGALIILLTASAASAQLSTAELSGRVTDTSGAVLPGVTVTMTQTDTQATRTAVTDADGTYVISNLPTGPYRLEVSLPGFRSYVQNGIVLHICSTAPSTTIRRTTRTCRCRFRTRCRNSAWRPAASPRRTACTRARRSTR